LTCLALFPRIQAEMLLRSLLAVCVLATLLCAQESPSESGRVHTEMRNVVYHYTASVSVYIIHLEGELVPVGEAGMPVFEDPNSFLVDVRSAELSISTAALANVMNQYAFAAPDAPIKAIRVAIQGGKLQIQGRLRKGDLPFESDGSLAVTPDGEIRVHTEKVKAVHVPVKGLMDLLGENIAQLIDTKKVRGVRAEGDDLILNPTELFPPPHIRGKLSSIDFRSNAIALKYGGPPERTVKVAGNYMAYRGARLRFGKLTMNNTDLTLIDLDPQDPLDFFLDHYWDQLVAGYSKITHTFGLHTYCRDYNKLTSAQKTAKKVTR
jgi:hypothetical protein